MLYYIVCSIVPHFFIFVEKEASCLMQWKNASLKYESQTARLLLTVLTPNYANAVLNFQNRNRESFEAYEPTRPANFYTASYQQAVLKCEWDLALKQQCIRFYVFRKDDPQMIIGTVCLHDIRFAAYSCTEIGYKFDAAFRRMGYASEAIKKVMSLAFYDLHLHFLCTAPVKNVSILSDSYSSKKRYQQPNRFSTCSGINSGNPKMIAMTRS